MRLLALLITLIALPAGATVVERFDLPQLVAAAELIVVGEVESTRAAWRGGRIITTVTIAQPHALKGASAGPVELEVLGGTVDGLAQSVKGMASFATGERVTVFLRRNTAGAWRTVGLSQGKLRVEAGLTGLQLVRQFDGLSLVVQQDGKWTPAEAALPARAEVSDFLVRLQSALEATP